jgi:hypothetical protein
LGDFSALVEIAQLRVLACADLMGSSPSACPLPSNMDPQAVELLAEIRQSLPFADDWLQTPHNLLGGDTPEQRIVAGDIERVRNLFESILYIGIT